MSHISMGKASTTINPARITAAMDLLSCLVIKQIAQEQGISREQALADFLSSRTADMLFHDEPSKLWWDGPAAIAEMYMKEKQ